MTVAADGSKFWVFHKTLSKDGDGPAEIWESPPLLERSDASLQDSCITDWNSTWTCSLSDRDDVVLVTHR